MTGFGDVPTVLPGDDGRKTRLLIPILTAVLVLALGLLLVSLTSDSSASNDSAATPTATSTTNRAAW
jgi:hypothetical protein